VASLENLEIILREMEEDILGTNSEIDRQRDVVRNVDDPTERRFAEHVLTTFEIQRSETLVQHEQLSREIAEKRKLSLH
jgi:hypothetical protein